MKASFLCGAIMLLLVPAGWAQEANQTKPDFSGTWLLVRGSIRVDVTFGSPAVAFGRTFTITQDATTLTIAAEAHFYPFGPRTYRLDGVWTIEPIRESLRDAYEDMFNGRVLVPSFMKTKASWNGRSLALVMSSDLPNTEVTRALRLDEAGLLTIDSTLPRELPLTSVYKKQ